MYGGVARQHAQAVEQESTRIAVCGQNVVPVGRQGRREGSCRGAWCRRRRRTCSRWTGMTSVRDGVGVAEGRRRSAVCTSRGGDG